ncbi:MAG: malate dehydrogenase [Actinomycetota bacterium]|nr:malate dehydrogenase [Actinomycetota bacterium]
MKVAIVGGAGGVGSSLAFNLLLLDGSHDVVLLDSDARMIESHVMDLEQSLLLGSGGSVRGGGDDDVLDADVVVLTASVPLALNTSRMVYLHDNVAIVGGAADLLATAGAWPGVVVVVTNPVDPLCSLTIRRSALDPRRVVGYTLNDNLRLRSGLSRALRVPPRDIDAWVIGEHGDACVPLFSRVRVRGEPVQPTAEQREAAERFLRGWYRRHVALDSGRTSTWTSGLGVARMLMAIATGDDGPWPASVRLAGEYGLEDVCLSVPVSLGRGGAEVVHEWELADDELEALRASAAAVREADAAIGPAQPAG